jgi:intracellular multiplication protein IcmL
MSTDALELVRLRNNFYRDNYRRLVGILLVLIFINLGLIGSIVYLITHRPAPQYFATSTDGRITPLYPMSEPVVTPPELLQWANEAVVAAYTYNFVNYREELQDTSQYFTPDGWTQFQTGLKASRNLETVIARKMVVSATATGAPSITDQGILNGRYAWRIKIPLLATYENNNERIQQPVTVNILVLRVSNLETPKGVAIAQFYASERPLTDSSTR